MINVGFRADIDTASGLVEKHHFRLRHQRFAEHHLLLVAAAERGDRQIGVAHLDRQFANHLFDAGDFFLRIQPFPRPAKSLQAEIREGHIRLNRHHLHHAFALTVFRYQRQPFFQPRLERGLFDIFAVEMDVTVLAGHQADQAFKQLRASGAEQAVDADHFSLT